MRNIYSFRSFVEVWITAICKGYGNEKAGQSELSGFLMCRMFISGNVPADCLWRAGRVPRSVR